MDDLKISLLSNSTSLETPRHVSGAMKILKNKSKIAAKSKLSKKFSLANNLNDITTIKLQIEKELYNTEIQVNSIVETKLDAIKRSMDLMDEASNKLTLYSKLMIKVNNKLQQTNTEINKYQYLKKVNNIKINLNKVINQIEYFANVPNKILLLRQQLYDQKAINRHHINLREIIIETISLDSLRIEVVKKMIINEEESSLKESIEQFLGSVPELVVEIAEYVLSFFNGGKGGKTSVTNKNSKNKYNNDDEEEEGGHNSDPLGDFIDYAITHPADLVARFEVVEMYQDYYTRRVKHATAGEGVSGTGTGGGTKNNNTTRTTQSTPTPTSRTFTSDFEAYNIQHKVRRALITAIEQRVTSCFDTHTEAALQTGSSQVTAVVDAGSDLVKLLVDIINEVDICIPPYYELVPTYFRAFERALTPRIDSICSNNSVNTLKVTDIFNLIDWIRYFVEQMTRFHLRDEPCCNHYLTLCDDVLLQEYLERIKAQILTLFDNIDKQAIDIVESSEGRQMTTAPEDMFNVAYIQLGTR